MLFLPSSVTMSKGEIKCLIAHAARDGARPNLYAVALDAVGRRAFATDGLRLAVACGSSAAPTDEHVRPFLVPIAAAEQAAKFAACRFSCDGNHVRWEGFDRVGVAKGYTAPVATGEADVVGAPPVPIRHVIPRPVDQPAHQVSFSTKRMADLALLDAAGVRSITVRFGADAEDPASITGVGDDVEWLVVMMPVRL